MSVNEGAVQQESRDDRDLLEWAEWEIEKVERSLLAVSAAMGLRPETGRASIPDSALDGLLCILSERLSESRKAINTVIEESLQNAT